MGPVLLRQTSVPADRTSDRVIAAASIGMAVAFVGAAGLALALPDGARHRQAG